MTALFDSLNNYVGSKQHNDVLTMSRFVLDQCKNIDHQVINNGVQSVRVEQLEGNGVNYKPESPVIAVNAFLAALIKQVSLTFELCKVHQLSPTIEAVLEWCYPSELLQRLGTDINELDRISKIARAIIELKKPGARPLMNLVKPLLANVESNIAGGKKIKVGTFIAIHECPRDCQVTRPVSPTSFGSGNDSFSDSPLSADEGRDNVSVSVITPNSVRTPVDPAHVYDAVNRYNAQRNIVPATTSSGSAHVVTALGDGTTHIRVNTNNNNNATIPSVTATTGSATVSTGGSPPNDDSSSDSESDDHDDVPLTRGIGERFGRMFHWGRTNAYWLVTVCFTTVSLFQSFIADFYITYLAALVSVWYEYLLWNGGRALFHVAFLFKSIWAMPLGPYILGFFSLYALLLTGLIKDRLKRLFWDAPRSFYNGLKEGYAIRIGESWGIPKRIARMIVYSVRNILKTIRVGDVLTGIMIGISVMEGTKMYREWKAKKDDRKEDTKEESGVPPAATGFYAGLSALTLAGKVSLAHAKTLGQLFGPLVALVDSIITIFMNYKKPAEVNPLIFEQGGQIGRTGFGFTYESAQGAKKILAKAQSSNGYKEESLFGEAVERVHAITDLNMFEAFSFILSLLEIVWDAAYSVVNALIRGIQKAIKKLIKYKIPRAAIGLALGLLLAPIVYFIWKKFFTVEKGYVNVVSNEDLRVAHAIEANNLTANEVALLKQEIADATENIKTLQREVAKSKKLVQDSEHSAENGAETSKWEKFQNQDYDEREEDEREAEIYQAINEEFDYLYNIITDPNFKEDDDIKPDDLWKRLEDLRQVAQTLDEIRDQAQDVYAGTGNKKAKAQADYANRLSNQTRKTIRMWEHVKAGNAKKGFEPDEVDQFSSVRSRRKRRESRQQTKVDRHQAILDAKMSLERNIKMLMWNVSEIRNEIRQMKQNMLNSRPQTTEQLVQKMESTIIDMLKDELSQVHEKLARMEAERMGAAFGSNSSSDEEVKSEARPVGDRKIQERFKDPKNVTERIKELNEKLKKAGVDSKVQVKGRMNPAARRMFVLKELEKRCSNLKPTKYESAVSDEDFEELVDPDEFDDEEVLEKGKKKVDFHPFTTNYEVKEESAQPNSFPIIMQDLQDCIVILDDKGVKDQTANKIGNYIVGTHHGSLRSKKTGDTVKIQILNRLQGGTLTVVEDTVKVIKVMKNADGRELDMTIMTLPRMISGMKSLKPTVPSRHMPCKIVGWDAKKQHVHAATGFLDMYENDKHGVHTDNGTSGAAVTDIDRNKAYGIHVGGPEDEKSGRPNVYIPFTKEICEELTSPALAKPLNL